MDGIGGQFFSYKVIIWERWGWRREEGNTCSSSDCIIYHLTYRSGHFLWPIILLDVWNGRISFILKSIMYIYFKLWHLHTIASSWMSPNHAKMPRFFNNRKEGPIYPKIMFWWLYMLYTCIVRYIYTSIFNLWDFV